jgi:hypothetical protein
MVGIEREISGQCDYGAGAFESIQIKQILNRHFEIVLKTCWKRSKLDARNAGKPGLSVR